MSGIAFWVVLAAAVIQLGFAFAETFRWVEKVAPLAKLPPEVARATVGLGKNFAIYNLLIALGLIWAAFYGAANGAPMAYYLGAFMVVAGVVAGPTASWIITMAQGGAGLLVLLSLCI
ncbi:DUF1304 family protein [Methylopila sp. M107]|uniref:DUF1304 family protein n=1 Tax=Methylopila sp. M107 TaxID=1101190 RepID=UPI0003787923|nr:DUF1304 family protein [Methylopila sp. M107]